MSSTTPQEDDRPPSRTASEKRRMKKHAIKVLMRKHESNIRSGVYDSDGDPNGPIAQGT